jgi:hypothetical protein
VQTAIAELFVFLAKIVWWASLAGSVVSNGIVLIGRGGLLDVAGGLVLLPLTLLILPFYAAFAVGDWRPIVFTFIGPLVGVALWLFGRALRASALGQ